MEPQKAPLWKLFDGKVSYLVPNYQRLYVWSQEDQWEPLWLDVQRLASAQAQFDLAQQQAEGIHQRAIEPHFMGAVVLKSSGNTPDLATQWRVIDGQQRLTTLQLLLAATERSIRSLDEKYADRLLDLITNTGHSSAAGFDQFKISFQRHKRGHDYESLGPVLRAALSGADTAEISGPIAACYRYFEGAISEWLGAHSNPELAAAALGATLLSKIFVIGLYLDDHEKEHIIFETLNARGEPLTEWDKAKNYLLFKAEESPDLDPAIVFEDFLDRFDDQWWRQWVGRGAQVRPRTDVFLDYWLESKTQEPVSARRVFREFQTYLEGRQHLTAAVLKELVSDAEHYRKWESFEGWEDSREALYHFRRRSMDLGAIWPVLLRLNNIALEQPERSRSFDVLESYFIRRLITGYQARSYDTVAMDLLKALPSQAGTGVSPSEILLRELLSYTGSGTWWPEDVSLEDATLRRHMPRYVQRLALSAIELQLTSPMAAKKPDIANLHVEHIMPQGWTESNWPLPDSSDNEVARQERDTLIQSLGNLTLLNGRLNAAVSNSSWAIKREKFEKHENLFLTRKLLSDAGESWTEDDIVSRGEYMYNLLNEIWPRG